MAKFKKEFSRAQIRPINIVSNITYAEVNRSNNSSEYFCLRNDWGLFVEKKFHSEVTITMKTNIEINSQHTLDLFHS